MVKGIGNVVIAVKDIKDTLRVYGDLLGLHEWSGGTHEVPGSGLILTLVPVGDVFLEFVQPVANAVGSQQSRAGKSIEKRGEGFYGLTFRVDDIKAELKKLSEKGVPVVDKEPRQGMTPSVKLAFINPTATMGVLVGLVEGGLQGNEPVNRFDHVGIAVKDLDQALRTCDDLFGIRPDSRGIIQAPFARAAMLSTGNGFVELMQPTVAPDHPRGDLARFVQDNGEGLHHLALFSDNISADVQRLKEKGVKMTESAPELAKKYGMMVMLYPEFAKGVRIQLMSRRVAQN